MFKRARTWLHRVTHTGPERRQFPRHPTNVETVCHSLAIGSDLNARIRDVSRSGVRLEVPQEIPVGTMIRLHIPSSDGQARTELLACVTNAQSCDGSWTVGCMFSVELTDAEMKLLGGEKTPAGPDDQRAWVRYPACGTVTYHCLPAADPTPRMAEVVNVSPAGIGLVVDQPLEPGEALTLHLRRQNEQPDRPMLACVVYLTKHSEGKWAVGCNFIHVLDEAELQELVWQPPPESH